MKLFNFSRSNNTPPEKYPEIIRLLNPELRALREQWFFAALSNLKAGGIIYDQTDKVLQPGSELESAIKGFQLTCVVGFTTQEGYVSLSDNTEFDVLLKNAMAPTDREKTIYYNDKYLTCRGCIESLSDFLTEDIFSLLGDPYAAMAIKNNIRENIPGLGVMCQAITSANFGDSKTEKKLKSLMATK